MGCQVAIADKIVEHKGDYLLALKGNQPTLEAEVADYFNSAPAEELVVKDAKLKGARPCIEMRTYTASSNVDWIVSTGSLTERPVTGASRACTGCPTSSSGRSLALPQRSRRQDRAIVRCFVLGLVRANKSKRSVKTRRKSASWDTSYLLELLHK
jgi:hypothetical protein